MKLQIARFLAVVVAALFLIHSPIVQAQSVYAALHGTVTDASGAVVPGATVTALNTSTGSKTAVTTDSNGYYIFPQLQIGGPYTIEITASGFQHFKSNGLMLNLNDNLAISARLEVGSSAQTIQVNAAAVQVETSDTQLKQVISANEIEELPLLARNAIALQKTTPGVMESSDRFGNFSTNGNQTQENSYLLDGTVINDGPLEDQEININPDALAEFNVVSSTLNPEFARNSGAVLNEVVKSGSNEFHGSGFEFYRDTFLNNGNYFSATRPPFHQNDYGGTFGGPLFKNHTFFFVAYEGLRNTTSTTTLTRVPYAGEVANGNFTLDANQLTAATNGTGLSTNKLPFAVTSSSGATCNPGTAWNACFKPNASGQLIIPTSNYNSIASTLTNTYVPQPNFSLGGTPFYNFNSPNTAAEDQGIIRIDEQLTPNDLIWASSVFQSTPDTTGLPFVGATLPGFTEIDTAHIKIFTADYTHTFNASTLNNLHAGYFRYFFGAVEPLNPTLPSSVGFTGITPQLPTSAGLPVENLTGLFSLGFSSDGPQPRHDANYDFADNFSKVLGSHNLKLGAHFERFSVDNPYYESNSGTFSYAGTGVFSSGDPLIDFLLGIPDGFEQGSGGIINAHAMEEYAYAQDNWKVSSDLTLNYGLAWDAESPYANAQFGGEGIFCWAPTGQSKVFPTAPPGLLYPGDNGCNRNGGPTAKYDHFGPRVGFAWSPNSGPEQLIGTPGAHLFAVRGGFGLYFNRDSEEASLQNLADPPFGLASAGALNAGGSPGFANPYQDVDASRGLNATNPFPFTPPPVGSAVNFNNYEPLEAYSIDPNYTVPYTYNFNLNVQRALASNMVLQIGYVGSLGRKLVRADEADTITAAGHAACVANPACVASAAITSAAFPQYFTQPGVNSDGNPYYYTIGRTFTNGASSYNALQASLTKGLTHGLYFTLAYTYSHGLDDASGYESSFGGGDSGGAVVNQVPGFQYLGYGDSDYDARNRFVALYNYEIPILRSMNDHAIMRESLGGWHVTGTTTLQTGFPVGIFESGTNASLWCNGSETTYFGCSDVPETSSFNIPTLNPRKTGNYWFNPSPFSPEPTGTFGNVKRNFLHGPGFNYSNMELYKDFPLGRSEARYIQLRLESYNTFNHANFALPDGNFSAGPSFGQISNVLQPGTGDPQPGRAVQIAGKFYF
jgi:hypothetical protein